MNTFFLVMMLTFTQPSGIIEYVDVPLEVNYALHYSDAAKVCETELIKVKNELIKFNNRQYSSGTCRRITKEQYNFMLEENGEK